MLARPVQGSALSELTELEAMLVARKHPIVQVRTNILVGTGLANTFALPFAVPRAGFLVVLLRCSHDPDLYLYNMDDPVSSCFQ